MLFCRAQLNHCVANRLLLQYRVALVCRHVSRSLAAHCSDQTRFNEIRIQMLSKSLHDQLFGGRQDHVPADTLNAIREDLRKHNLWGRQGQVTGDTNFKLPELLGKNPDDHFKQIAIEQSEPYLNYAKRFIRGPLPRMPNEWLFHSGWTKYDTQTGDRILIDYPDDEALVFDVEVCVKDSPLPVLAVAASESTWYSWVSSRLVERQQYGWLSQNVVENLIPFESVGDGEEMRRGERMKRLVVGHMVGYDRARIREQYDINASHTKFLDTGSLHMCVSGFSSLQRSLVMKRRRKKGKKTPWEKVGAMNSLEEIHQFYVGGEKLDKTPRDTFVEGTLSDVYDDFQRLMLYCACDVRATHQVLCVVLPMFLERLPHPVTFAGMLEMGLAYLPVDQMWCEYVDMADKVYGDLEREMKSNLMKLADEACSYGHNEQYKYDPWLHGLDWKVPKYLKKRRLKTLSDEVKKTLEKKVIDEDVFQPDVWRQHLPGYPNWYRKLCPRIEEQTGFGVSLISANSQVTPSLLRLQWDGRPLYHMKNSGWGYLVPVGDDTEKFNKLVENSLEIHNRFAFDKQEAFVDKPVTAGDVVRFVEELDVLDIACTDVWHAMEALELEMANENGNVGQIDENQEMKIAVKKLPGLKQEIVLFDHPLLGKVRFVPLPHKDGDNHNVGNPLAKTFLSRMEDGTLTSGSGDLGKETLRLNGIVSFWRSNRKRILDQFTVWLHKQETSQSNGMIIENSQPKFGVILPQVRVAGTVTRRAVEPTWLTASNAKEDRLGSEQKAMIQAPSGYCFVGADVDSQELWIAAILGDSQFAGIHGCTPFGWMTLQGQKTEGTDLHSKTAATIGISRDQAKIFNYGRIYGAGLPFAVHMLQQFNHQMTEEDATEKAKQLYAATKGTRRYQVSNVGFDLCQEHDIMCDENGEISSEEMAELRFLTKKSPRTLSINQRWRDGSESEMFNKLESVISGKQPCTPVLGCRISRALDTSVVGETFKTNRINWVVQSSAVDYLHLLLVSMRWLFDTYNIEGRFSISIHDEVRYLVRSKDRYRAALALQISNLLTRVMFAYKLGMNDLPQAVAFFSAVDIDTVLRKEVNMDCQTPSNPHGLEKRGIQHGEALDIYSILKLTNGGHLEHCSQSQDIVSPKG